MEVTFRSELWVWDARKADTWTFVSLPAEVSAEIRDLAAVRPRQGFGSVRVRVTIGASTWSTSAFPDADRGYVVPVKKSVRRAERVDAGDAATVTVVVLDL